MKSTLGNMEWCKEHLEEIRSTLPEDWTHLAEFDIGVFKGNLWDIGVNCHTNDDAAHTLTFFEKTGISELKGAYIKRGDKDIFKED